MTMERPDITEQKKRLLEGKGKVRLARFDDLDAVIDINDNIYDGGDYMPAYFYIYMQSKQHKIYVYEENGKLIALNMFRFHPDEDGLVTMMSGRVHPSSMGRGFGRGEVNPIIAQFQKDHPQVTRCLSGGLYTPNIEAKMKVWKQLYRWNYLRYRIPDTDWLCQRITSHRSPTNAPLPAYLSYSKAVQWLNESDEIVQFLSKYASEYVPLGAEWLPIRINRFGLRQIFSDANCLMTSEQTVISNKDQSSTRNVDFKGKDVNSDVIDQRQPRDVNKILGLSFSMYLPCKRGIRMDISFFGDSKDVFLNHLKSHLIQSIIMVKEGVEIVYRVHFPLTIDSKSVDEKLNGTFGEQFITDNFNVTQAVEYIAEIPKSKL